MGVGLTALTLLGCGSDAGATGGEETPTLAPELAVDPASPAAAPTLAAPERDLLARANGRRWDPGTPAELEAFLRPAGDSVAVVYLWDPASGASGLAAVQRAFAEAFDAPVRTAFALRDGGDAREALIDLRASQAVAPTFLLVPGAGYPFLPEGRLPADDSYLVGSAAAPIERLPAGGSDAERARRFAAIVAGG